MTETINDQTDMPAAWLGLDGAAPDGLSVVTPMYHEEGGAADHVRDIADILSRDLADIPAEIIVVDDGSRDGTVAELLAAREEGLSFRLLSHTRNAGQSRAIRTGVIAARYPIIAMIDGDRQNLPEDIPALYRQLVAGAAATPPLAMVAGERQKREDTGAKRFASRIANQVRQALLKDGARDSGCGLKLFYRDAFLRLAYFDHLHRYLPFMMKREGFAVAFAPVNHRARSHGASKYTNIGRLAVAFRDLAGVLWLRARARDPDRIIVR